MALLPVWPHVSCEISDEKSQYLSFHCWLCQTQPWHYYTAITLPQVDTHVTANTDAHRLNNTVVLHYLLTWNVIHWAILLILTLPWIWTNRKVCYPPVFVTWYHLRRSKSGKRIIARAPWMYAVFGVRVSVPMSRQVDSWNQSCLALSQIAVSHPLTAPEGVRTKTTAQGLSVHTHETQAWITQGSNMTHPKKGVEEGPLCCFEQMYTQTHTARNNSYITGLERGPCGSPHLPKTDVKNKSETSSNWREAPHCCTNSPYSTRTKEQTAAHENTA